MKSDINGSLLTVSDPSILEILRLAVYGVVEGRKFLQHLRHEEKPDKQNVCHDANVSEAISERLDNFLSLARVPASPPHNLDPREISDEAIEAKRLEGAITRLDDARATLLAPLPASQGSIRARSWWLPSPI